MSKKTIYICSPGQPKWQEKFWEEAVVKLGIEREAKPLAQSNAFTHTLFPTEVLRGTDTTPAMNVEEIMDRQEAATRNNLARQWFPSEPELAMVDYEPDKDGRNWQYQKLLEGYDSDDLHVLMAMIQGAMRVKPSAQWSMYNTGMLPAVHNWDDMQAAQSILSIAPMAKMLPWSWQGMYVNRNPLNNAVDRDLELRSKLDSKMLIANKLMRLNTSRVIPAFFPRHFQDTTAYHSRAFELLTLTGSNEAVIWVKCGERTPELSEFMVNEYVKQVAHNLPAILQWLEG